MAKLTIQNMAKMGALLLPSSEYDYDSLYEGLRKEANEAGVFWEASGDGLTMEQWEAVRNPTDFLRKAILALDPKETS